MRSRTQLPHLEPPYARWTVFLGLEIWAYSWGRSAGIYEVSSQHNRFPVASATRYHLRC